MGEEERFWSKVEDAGGCWLWTAAKRRNGYGCFKFQGHLVGAHRVAYILVHGNIPGELVVMHSCDNRLCVNPDHLSPGSWSDNTQDAMEKARHSLPPGSGKLTIEDVREIRELYAGSGEYAWIARLFKVNKKTVRQIILGKIWREPDTVDTLSDTLTDEPGRISLN